MTTKDEWILYLEKHPQFNELAKSGLYISILKLIRQTSLNIDKLYTAFPMIEKADLDLILASLLKLELVTKIRAGGNILYILSPEGIKLLSIYKKTREGFKIE